MAGKGAGRRLHAANTRMKIITPPSHLPPDFRLPKPQPSVDAKVEAENRWRALRRLTALLSLEIYPGGLLSATKPAIRDHLFLDSGLDLCAHAYRLEDTVIITFRGTLPPMLFSANWSKVNLALGWVEEPPRHRGFHEAWMKLKHKIVAWLQNNPCKKIVLTGHSLGAALAQLAAFDLANAYSIECVFLYAPPMVGDRDFNKAYAEKSVHGKTIPLGTLTTRYLLLTDAISLPVPRLLGFVPGEPVRRINRFGQEVNDVPSFVSQVLDDMASDGLDKTILGTRKLDMALPNSDLGPPTAVHQFIPGARLGAITMGGWWLLVYPLVAAGSAIARAVGFHSMEGYAKLLGVTDEYKKSMLARLAVEPTTPDPASAIKPE